MYLLLIFSIILGVVCLDQATKWLAVLFLKSVETVPIWKGVFHLTYITNDGAAFGMLDDARWVFLLSSTVAIAVILFYLIRFRPQNKLFVTALSMIAGGGLGNMIDRIGAGADRAAVGEVVDFLDFRLINFAIFNVADSFVTVGACLLILYLLLDLIQDAKKKKIKVTAKAEIEVEISESTTEEQSETEQDHE